MHLEASTATAAAVSSSSLPAAQPLRRLASMLFFCLLLVASFPTNGVAYTLYDPQSLPGTTYYIEAAREGTWPSCPYRFLSVPSSCSSSTVDLWSGAGASQEWQMVPTGDANSDYFYLKSVSCGRYLSYSSDCSSSSVVDTWSEAGINQKFRLFKGSDDSSSSSSDSIGTYYMEAVGRAQCDYKYLSFPVSCTTNSPDKIDFWLAAGTDQRFRIHPVRSLNAPVHKVASEMICPDPYVWQPKNTDAVSSSSSSSSSKSSLLSVNTTVNDSFLIQCTGDGLKLGQSASMTPSEVYFTYIGDSLGGNPSPWAADSFMGSRWAPENYEHPTTRNLNFMFFADSQSSDDGNHRIGYVVSTAGPLRNSWNVYSPSYLNLGMQPGGDIDIDVFTDPITSKTYITWKTDDNNVGSTFTRLWLQEVVFNPSSLSVTLLESPQVIMDSTGLWWVDSWVQGGSLVEAPELLYKDGYYYLFFASGKFCQDTYKEGVARSRSVYGPYEKLSVPLLSNGLTGVAVSPTTGQIAKLVGPGHAAVLAWSNSNSNRSNNGTSAMKMAATTTTDYSLIYHASIGENCDRYAFVNTLSWGADGWPFLDL